MPSHECQVHPAPWVSSVFQQANKKGIKKASKWMGWGWSNGRCVTYEERKCDSHTWPPKVTHRHAHTQKSSEKQAHQQTS
jgi:hypothetical protein